MGTRIVDRCNNCLAISRSNEQGLRRRRRRLSSYGEEFLVDLVADARVSRTLADPVAAAVVAASIACPGGPRHRLPPSPTHASGRGAASVPEGQQGAAAGALPDGAHLKWDPERKCWRLAARWMTVVVDEMANAGQHLRVEVELRGKAAGGERCDARCRDAEGYDCSCECEGRYHGVSRWPAGFAHIAAKDTEIGVKTRYVTQVYEVNAE